MRGVISAGDKITALTGKRVLEMGGNAFDSACASMLSAPLSEPMLTSLGGGGFMLTYQNNKPTMYDFFVDVPPKREQNPDFYPIYVDFGSTIQEFHIGSASIAIPGVVAGIYQIHKEKGKLPLSEIVKPAIEYASKGIYLSKLQASFIKLLEPIMTSTNLAKELFVKNDRVIDETHLFKNSEYANFLEEFAKEGARLFYEGEIANKIDKLSRENEGIIRKEDLKRYRVIKREPIDFKFKNYEIITNPPPSAGGVLIAFALKILENRDLKEYGSITHIQNLIETLVVSADFRKEFINEHLHREGLSDILKDSHLIENFLHSQKSRVNLWGNTTHISVIDEEGNAATVTTTNGEGSGYIIPNTGIMLNNMLGEEDLNPHGFFKWPSFVRLPSMMAPTIVLENNKPKLVLGSSGSNRIRSAIVQGIINNLIFNKPVSQMTHASRIHYENQKLFFEPNFDKKIVERAKKLYEVIEFDKQNLFFGGVNAVTSDLKGGSDPRRGGCVEIAE